MAIRTNGGIQFVSAGGLPALTFPSWHRFLLKRVGLPSSDVPFFQVSGTGGSLQLWANANGNTLLRVAAGSNYDRSITEFPGSYFNALAPILVVWSSLTSVTIYWNGGSLTATNSGTGISSVTGINIGNAFGSSSGTTITAAELFSGTGVPDATQRTALLTASQQVESIAGLTTLWGWSLNPAGAAGTSAGSQDAIVGSVAMSNSGMLIATDTHPVTRASPVILSGGYTLGDIVASGGLATVTGEWSVPALTNWAGAVQAGVAVNRLSFARLSDGVQVLVLNDQTANGAGTLGGTSSLLTPGTWYMVTGWSTDGTQRFALPVQAV